MNGTLKSYKTSWLDQNLSNHILKQLSDGASTTKDGKELHNKVTNTFSWKFFLLSYLIHPVKSTWIITKHSYLEEPARLGVTFGPVVVLSSQSPVWLLQLPAISWQW